MRAFMPCTRASQLQEWEKSCFITTANYQALTKKSAFAERNRSSRQTWNYGGRCLGYQRVRFCWATESPRTKTSTKSGSLTLRHRSDDFRGKQTTGESMITRRGQVENNCGGGRARTGHQNKRCVIVSFYFYVAPVSDNFDWQSSTRSSFVRKYKNTLVKLLLCICLCLNDLKGVISKRNGVFVIQCRASCLLSSETPHEQRFLWAAYIVTRHVTQLSSPQSRRTVLSGSQDLWACCKSMHRQSQWTVGGLATM